MEERSIKEQERKEAGETILFKGLLDSLALNLSLTT
jgi:hypothetical protein